LPIKIENDRLVITWINEWDLSYFEKKSTH
jgi:hypothetical protein